MRSLPTLSPTTRLRVPVSHAQRRPDPRNIAVEIRDGGTAVCEGRGHFVGGGVQDEGGGRQSVTMWRPGV